MRGFGVRFFDPRRKLEEVILKNRCGSIVEQTTKWKTIA